MSDKPTAETPEPFPSIETPTTTPPPAAQGSAPRSYRELERTLTPLPDSSHRPTPAEAEDAERPRAARVSASGGADAFPAVATVAAAVEGLDGVDVSDLEVDVVAGVVTLAGSVARTSDRDRLITALGKVGGVTEVVDRLRVRID